MLFWHLGALILFGLILAVSAQVIIRAASSFARRFHIRSFIVGFLVLGLATSTPEFSVGVQSVLDGVPQLSIGNLLGGSILLLSLVMGISALIMGQVSLNHGMTFGSVVFASIVVGAPAFVLWDGVLSRVDGVFLVALTVFHAVILGQTAIDGKLVAKRMKKTQHSGRDAALLVAGLAGMAVSSKMVVESAEVVIGLLGIPLFWFGLFFLSLGTNLPELTLAITAAVTKKRDIAFGDFLGSSAVNTLFIGFLGIVSPFVIANHRSLLFSLVLLVSLLLYFIWCVKSRQVISRLEGVGLLIFYGILVVYELRWGGM